MTQVIKSILKPFNEISTGWVVLVVTLSVLLLKASWDQLGDKQNIEKKAKFVLMFKHGRIATQLLLSVLAILILVLRMTGKFD